jgi:hypothetical protein
MGEVDPQWLTTDGTDETDQGSMRVRESSVKIELPFAFIRIRKNFRRLPKNLISSRIFAESRSDRMLDAIELRDTLRCRNMGFSWPRHLP